MDWNMHTELDRRRINELESPFAIEELFFSHTDRKGKIIYGNDVFERVAEYQLSEMEGRPHNIIRHPDMPKAVFHLLWETILAGGNIVAYVKNRSKTGKYYWVVALVFPFKEGFLSIRLKPSSPLQPVVEDLYSKMLNIEKGKGMEESAKFLMQKLGELGFESYEQFGVEVLRNELNGRVDKMMENPDKIFGRAIQYQRFKDCSNALKGISEQYISLAKDSAKLEKKFKEFKLICLNMLANLEQYENESGPLSVTANTFEMWGGEIEETLSSFLGHQKDLEKRVSDSQKALAYSFLQNEMSDYFAISAGPNKTSYLRDLSRLAIDNKRNTEDKIRLLLKDCKRFERIFSGLKESLVGMKIIQLGSKIEAAHLSDSGRKISSTITGIEEFVAETEDKIEQIGLVFKSVKLLLHKMNQYQN
jgi:aerotaxis receptor